MKKSILLLLFIFSCSEGPETIVFPPVSVQPIVTGIIIMDDIANEIGIWGIPSYSISSAYPNPTVGNTRLTFQVPKTLKVSIYAVKAQGSYELSNDIFYLIGNAGYLASPVTKITILERKLFAGKYGIDFSIPESGFYRIYYQIGDFLFWTDILNLPDIESYYEFLENH